MTMLRLPPILRQRWTWRYALSSAVILYASYCILFAKPFFSSDLPQYTGPYGVGTINLEVPRGSRRIDKVVYKDSGLPAFELETVLFSVFYPAKKGITAPQAKHPWVSRPISLTAEGYLRLGHVNNFITNNILSLALWTLVGGRDIPAEVDIPLHSSETELPKRGGEGEAEASPSSFPVIIFSHGFASSRTDYTHYIGELASRGYIVAAIEHRDGSSPGSQVTRKDGSSYSVFLMSAVDLARDGVMNRAELKQIQLAFRQAEIEETYQVLREINDGKGIHIGVHNIREEGRTLQDWKDRLNLDQLTISGHSFGATGVLRALKGAPSKSLPIKSAIVLDPGKSSGPLNADVDVPTLVIHSNSWSKKVTIFSGSPHFDVVKNLVKGINKRGKAAWFLTSVGTSHPSVTDAPLLEPLLLSWTTGSTIDAREGVEEYVKVSMDFLKFMETGKRKGILAEDVTHSEYDKDIRDEKREEEMPKDIEKYWQIHVTPNE